MFLVVLLAYNEAGRLHVLPYSCSLRYLLSSTVEQAEVALLLTARVGGVLSRIYERRRHRDTHRSGLLRGRQPQLSANGSHPEGPSENGPAEPNQQPSEHLVFLRGCRSRCLTQQLTAETFSVVNSQRKCSSTHI